jgi:hypothetical protein
MATERTTGGQATQGYGQNNRRSGYTGLQTEQQEVKPFRERTEQQRVTHRGLFTEQQGIRPYRLLT